jgi:hypothetical protein
MTGSFSENLSQRGFIRAGGFSCDSSCFAPYFAFSALMAAALFAVECASFPPCAAECSLIA